MFLLSQQDIIPEYAHKMNLFIYSELKKNYLLTSNQKIINSISTNIKYIIRFYCGKRTLKRKREQTREEILHFVSIITNIYKIMGTNKKQEEFESFLVNAEKVCFDLELNQKGKM